MKISILGYGFVSWGGGLDFLKFFASAIDLAGGQGQIIFPVGEDRRDEIETQLRERFGDLNLELCFAKDQFAAAKAFGADVVLPCIYPPPKDFDIPWVGYVYDFQHRHLPHLFDESTMRSRDQEMATMLYEADHSICNSRDVLNDAKHYFGGFRSKLHAMPFSPYPEQGWLESDLDVRAMYGIDRPYFMVSNQFWVHKDHATALKAFAKIEGALLVLTGAMEDHRAPQYMHQLQAIVEETGIGPNIRVLGYIPKDHQVALIKHSLAMVQPTRFEGGPGGGAVYNAIALGVPALVSDIPVNREINCGDVDFFPPGDVDALAALMTQRLTPAPRPAYEKLVRDALARHRNLGLTLLDVCQQAIDDA
jgi:glycosyltransferase involved in cell wall biosynthesis